MTPVAPSDFSFATDDESSAYVRDIVKEMMRRFSITREKHISRINQVWAHWLSTTGEYELQPVLGLQGVVLRHCASKNVDLPDTFYLVSSH